MISSARVQATGAEAIRSQPMWVSQRDDQPREPEIELQDDITNYLAYGHTTSLQGAGKWQKCYHPPISVQQLNSSVMNDAAGRYGIRRAVISRDRVSLLRVFTGFSFRHRFLQLQFFQQ